MNKYTIYLRGRKKPIETIADKWEPIDFNYIWFTIDNVEVLRVDFNEMVAMRKEVIG